MAKHIFETIVGAVVLLVAAGFVFLAYHNGNNAPENGTYTLNARFDRVDGLQVGSDVRISGIKVGKIIRQTIDPATFMAIVTFSLDDALKLPADSSAEIIGDGLLGSKFLALVPGSDSEMYKEGDTITYTQSSISLESLIGKFVFGSADKDKKEAAPTPAPADEGKKNSMIPSF